MDDPLFQAEMEKYMKNDKVKQAAKAAEAVANDPEKLAAFQRQMSQVLQQGIRHIFSIASYDDSRMPSSSLIICLLLSSSHRGAKTQVYRKTECSIRLE